jgi:phage host-nuclease inhibitor protein Gam
MKNQLENNPTTKDVKFGEFAPAFGAPEEVPTGQKTAFVIDSEQGASWFVGKIAEKEELKARIKAQAAQRVLEIDADIARLKNLYDTQLFAWAQEEATRRRRKTITLPLGTVKITTVPAHVKITDKESALEHAQTLGEGFFSLVPTLDTTAYAKHAEEVLEKDGIVPAGCDFIPARENISYGVAKPKEKEAPSE